MAFDSRNLFSVGSSTREALVVRSQSEVCAPCRSRHDDFLRLRVSSQNVVHNAYSRKRRYPEEQPRAQLHLQGETFCSLREISLFLRCVVLTNGVCIDSRERSPLLLVDMPGCDAAEKQLESW
jgi:hypothetical protein